MILGAVVTLVATVLSGLLSVLPQTGWSPDLSGFGTMVGYFRAWDGVLPVAAMLACIGIVLLYQGASWIYHAANWVYRHIPFMSG